MKTFLKVGSLSISVYNVAGLRSREDKLWVHLIRPVGSNASFVLKGEEAEQAKAFFEEHTHVLSLAEQSD